MASKLAMVGTWIAVTVLMTVAALAAVNAAGDPLGEQPLRPVAPGELTAPTTTDAPPASIALPSTTTTSSVPEPTTPVTPPPTTTVSPAPSQTTAPATTKAPPTTQPPPQETTTTAPAQGETSAHQMVGGTVAISSSPGTVNLLWATPNAGFTAKVKESGPDEVEVEFKSSDHESRFEAEWSSGELEVSTEEKEVESDD